MVHLVGGGPGAIVAMRRHFRDAMAQVKTKQPLIAYVGAASKDSVGFRKMISLALGGARVEPANFASPRAKISESRQLLHDADLIFVSGGDVDLGMTILNERGVSAEIRTLKKPFLGVSAGAIMLAKHWVRFVDDDDDKAELFECLGIAPVHIDCHSEDDDWSELRVLMRLLPDGSVGHGIPAKGCLRWDGKPHAMGVPIARFKTHQGQAQEERPLS
jgi:peptidase E